MKLLQKLLLPLVIVHLPLSARADDEPPRDHAVEKKKARVVPDPTTVRALALLEAKMQIKFDIPFPAELDIDDYAKRPLALITINGVKVCATRPIVNPFDQPQTVEWTISPVDVALLSREGLDCSFDLDDRGEFSRLNIIADWSTDGKSNHQLERAEGESGADFFERARLTYQFRAKKAANPSQAELFLTAFEKIATTIQGLRKGEARAEPIVSPK